MKANTKKLLNVIPLLFCCVLITSQVKAQPIYQQDSAGIAILDIKFGNSLFEKSNASFLTKYHNNDISQVNIEPNSSHSLKNVFEEHHSFTETTESLDTNHSRINAFLTEKPRFITYGNIPNRQILIAEDNGINTNNLLPKKEIANGNDGNDYSLIVNSPNRIESGLN